MVFDGYRNATYFRALKKVITPDTTVMDLGAGLGVHGLNAAKLGAARVLLVEPANVIEIAREIAADNQLGNVECFPSRVEEMELDEKVDVIVSAFTGNFLLTEDLLPSLFHARDKYLAPGGKLIPDRARMKVVPVSVPDYYRKHIDRWSTYAEHAQEHGNPELDYQAVRAYAVNTMYYDTRKKFDATPLAAPAELMELDFTTATSASCDSKVEIEVEHDGTCHGWLGWFDMRLGDEWLSTSGEPGPTHWSPVFLPLEQPIEVKAGEQLGFALKRPEFGEWTWTTQQAENRQRQSTFLSQPLLQDRMRKASEDYQPRLNQRGEAAQWLLGQMRGEVNVTQLAIGLYELYPTTFYSNEEALGFVKDLVDNYSEMYSGCENEKNCG
jgi:predicted RNA methylase